MALVEDKVQVPAPASLRCGNITFPQTAQITLHEDFRILNICTAVDDAPGIERETRDQSDNQTWYNLRRQRLTASHFAEVYYRKAEPNKQLLNRLLSTEKQLNTPAIDYGRRHEPEAKQRYLAAKPHVHIHKCGLVINEAFSFLGASPDGKVCDAGECGIMEIKCPYNARNYTIAEAVEKVKMFMIMKNDNNKLTLKKTHSYYVQVQGQLMVTGTHFCDFVVLTKKELHIERIFPDHSFMNKLLMKLSKFYLNYAVPFLKQTDLLFAVNVSSSSSTSSNAPTSSTITTSFGSSESRAS
jgi:hypothetical protein